MKKLLIVFLPVLTVCACSSSPDRQTTQAKKLYIEEGEYETANKSSPAGERRAAPPIVESDYIFRVQPQETFYFDEKAMPLDAALKFEPKIPAGAGPMKRPKRYMGGAQADASAAPENPPDGE